MAGEWLRDRGGSANSQGSPSQISGQGRTIGFSTSKGNSCSKPKLLRPHLPPGREAPGLIPAAIVGGLLVLAGAGIVWFFSGDAPTEVDLEETASVVVEGGSTDSDATAEVDAATGAGSDISGIWAVDTSIGTFTLEDTTTATFVGYRVDEVLNSIGSTTAVGRTPEVSGSITLDGTTLVAVDNCC